MHQHLKFLVSVVNSIDNDPQKSMLFYTTALTTTTVENKPPKDIRWRLLVDSLYNFEAHLENKDIYDRSLERSVDDILDKLNTRYQNHQHLCWKSHEHHFHTTVQDYVNCPITCLCEIGEFLDKLVKEIYHQ